MNKTQTPDARIPIDTVLSAIQNGKHVLYVGGVRIPRLQSARMKTFLKGTKCVHCGLEGHFFAIKRSNRSGRWHLELYHESNSQLRMLNSDHIIAKANGGSNSITNRQPMCQSCNSTKANFSSVEEGKKFKIGNRKAKKRKAEVRKKFEKIFGFRKAAKILRWYRMSKRVYWSIQEWLTGKYISVTIALL